MKKLFIGFIFILPTLLVSQQNYNKLLKKAKAKITLNKIIAVANVSFWNDNMPSTDGKKDYIQWNIGVNLNQTDVTNPINITKCYFYYFTNNSKKPSNVLEFVFTNNAWNPSANTAKLKETPQKIVIEVQSLNTGKTALLKHEGPFLVEQVY